MAINLNMQSQLAIRKFRAQRGKLGLLLFPLAILLEIALNSFRILLTQCDSVQKDDLVASFLKQQKAKWPSQKAKKNRISDK